MQKLKNLVKLCSDEIKCVFFLSMQFINTIKYLEITLFTYLHKSSLSKIIFK